MQLRRVALLLALIISSVAAQTPFARQTKQPGGVAAILHEPGLPIKGMASSPAVIAAILHEAGIETEFLSADQLADAAVFNTAHFDLTVLPTGQSFPAAARGAMIDFLRHGGSFISTGGYTFNHLLRKDTGKWTPESDWVRDQIERALGAEFSLLSNGGFEQNQPVPIGGSLPDGHWRRSSEWCRLTPGSAKEGRFCAEVSSPPGKGYAGEVFWAELPIPPAKTYQIRAWLRTQDVTGPGMAYVAVYQHDAGGKLVEFRDFATARDTTDWQQYAFTFTPKPSVCRLRIPMGLYQAHGTAWFDDVRLGAVPAIGYEPMNTATGKPEDGLETEPAQIGVFDASFPLKRACVVRTAPGQRVVSEPIDQRGNFCGWAASGVIGSDHARWIPLLATYDRYGRPRGTAAALVLNYHGFYRGSAWAYFGIENVDLFQNPRSPISRSLQQVARFMVRKVFLRNLATHYRLYQPGEPVVAAVVADNRGGEPRRGRVSFSLQAASGKGESVTATRELSLDPGASQRLEVTLPQPHLGSDLGRVVATLSIQGAVIDEVESGFVREDSSVLQSGPSLRFASNYFTLNGRPVFLFGSDTYSSIYQSAEENPLTWSCELTAAREVGMNLYENLQYTKPRHQMDEADWRNFRALGQLVQKHRLVFMPGMLIGHNVAIGDEALAEQSALCREYARHLGDLPGLLYYLNGDYQNNLSQHPAEVNQLWNRWLKAEYGATDRLRSVWGTAAVTAELGRLEFPPPDSGRWDDGAAVDKMRFHTWLLTRWNQAHAEAVRGCDRQHPITSEYYSTPFAGMDLALSIDGLDVSNFGYFDRPETEFDNLPLRIRWNDLRARGKGVSLGEYGVKTHPAWTRSQGAKDYHIARTEEGQKQLFLMVAHYGLGLGVSKVQNWCLRDGQARVFPWGLFYPNQIIFKDIAYVHRNESILWRHFVPVHIPPRLVVVLANRLRLGNDERLGTEVAYRTFADLLALHYDFAVIDDEHLEQLSPAVKVMVYPAPFAMRDETYRNLLAWVRGGGTLLLTGDFSYDANRQRSAVARLADLAGVELLATHYPNIARQTGRDVLAQFALPGMVAQTVRPCLRVKPLSAKVLGQTTQGEPVLVRASLGGGQVYYFLDPIELADDEPAKAVRRGLYAAFLQAAGVQPLSVEPPAPWLHVMVQPTVRGKVHVVVNTRTERGGHPVQLDTAAGPLRLATRNGWPALAAVTAEGKVVAINADGRAGVKDQSLMDGTGLKMLLSLDGEDLRRSMAMLIAPLETGRIELPSRFGDPAIVIGEFQNGHWTVLERPAQEHGNVSLAIDADRATGLILVCPRAEEDPWANHLTAALLYPERIAGY